MSHPPKIPGSYQHTQVYHKTSLQPRKPSFGLMSLLVPFLPSALPSYPGLLVIRIPREERMLVGQVHVCSLPLPCLYTKQVARLYPTLPQGTFVLLADCLSLAVLRMSTLMGLCTGGRGQCLAGQKCGREISAQGTSGIQGLREMASRCMQGGWTPGIRAPSLGRSPLLTSPLVPHGPRSGRDAHLQGTVGTWAVR